MPPHKRLNLIIAFACFFVLVAVGGLKLWSDQQDARMISQFNSDRKKLVERLIALDGSAIEKMVADYGIWEDLVNFGNKPDTQWAVENVDTAVTGYGLGGLWVTDAKGRIVHQAGAIGKAGQQWEVFAKLPNAQWDKNVLSSFHWQDGQLFEITASQLRSPTSSKPSTGFFVVATPVDQKKVSGLSSLVSGKLELTTREPKASSWPSSEPRFHMAVPLEDINDVPVAWYKVESESPVLAHMQARASQTIAHFAFGLLGVVGLVSIVLRRFVAVPKAEFVKAIKEQDATDLAKVIGRDKDLGQVVELIDEVSGQHELQGMNLDLEGKVQQRTRQLEAATEASVMAFVEILQSRPESFTREQQTTIRLADQFAEYIGLSMTNRMTLSQGMVLCFYEANDGVDSLPWLNASILGESSRLSTLLDVARNNDKPWQSNKDSLTLESRIFAVVMAWVETISERDHTRETMVLAANNMNEQAGSSLDPGLVTEFLGFYKSQCFEQGSDQVA